MNLDDFLRQRSPTWQQLERLLVGVKSNPEHMSTDEIETLGRLYRMTTSDLALAQRDFSQQKVTSYLNQLV